MTDMTPTERAEAWHDRYKWKATGLPVDAAAISGLCKTIREAENAAYERAAKACKKRGMKIWRNHRLGGNMKDICGVCAQDIRVLKHKTD